MLSSQVSDMNEEFTRKDHARWLIEDVAERLAMQDEDWNTRIYMVGLRQKHEAERLVRYALSRLAEQDQPNQPTLDELCSAAREWVANSSQPLSSDNNNVPF